MQSEYKVTPYPGLPMLSVYMYNVQEKNKECQVDFCWDDARQNAHLSHTEANNLFRTQAVGLAKSLKLVLQGQNIKI